VQHNNPNQIHSHIFGQDKKRPGEFRTFIVIAITATMMVVEIAAGVLFGSMALLADGLHMASHAAALSINAFAYVFARKNAKDPSFSFGTGKVNALGGYSGAVLLAVFALIMAWESSSRLITPVEISFNQAILVAIIGLIVNGVSVFILGVKDHDHDDHDHVHEGDHDHNLKSAYLHVLTDALTSILAILALLSAKYFGFVWMDPLMGIVGAILVGRWSLGLIRSTSEILLDKQASHAIQKRIIHSIEKDGEVTVTDLHVWSIGPNIYAAIISVLAQKDITSEELRAQLPKELGIEHISIEINKVYK